MAIPYGDPFHNAAENAGAMAAAQRRGQGVGNGGWPGQRPPRQTNKTKVGGGFNLNFNVTDKGVPMGPGYGPAGQGGQGGHGTPGADFMSNEDIRAFAEYLRKKARDRAVERSMDAAQLEARLRNIPDSSGRMHGARARARRVTRYLKLIAAAEKAIAKWATALYSAFEREFEAELIKISKGRNSPNTSKKFQWT